MSMLSTSSASSASTSQCAGTPRASLERASTERASTERAREGAKPNRSAAEGPGSHAGATPGRSFGEVLRGVRGAIDEGRDRVGDGDAFLGVGERRRRGFGPDADTDCALNAFRVPASILQAPTAIARPTLEKRGGIEAAQAIADRVVERVHLEANSGGRLEFVMATRVEVLGGVEIRVRIDGGLVHATFATANPEARATLEAQLGQLRDSLVAKGLFVAEIATADPRFPQQDRGRERERERRQDRGHQADDDSSSEGR